MNRARKIQVLIVLACSLIAVAAVAYEFLIGFPRRFEDRFVHRVTVWAPDHHFERERMYYAYTSADGNEIKHGPFENFQEGRLVQQATYRDGKLDGALTFWNLLGVKTQELYYRAGTPFGWANFANGRLVSMHQEIMEDGRTAAVKNFIENRYSLEFRCGELMNVAIDPVSGQMGPVANASRRQCGNP
ncbi:MAG: toxin-antitoxin system YwqK family antitoxin [Candidatus Angelobacter sp.]